jgi:signal transduction histidine kinase
VIRHKLKDSGQGKECGYIDIMLKEIGRISNLVGEILLLSKPRQTDLRAVNVIKVLREILPIIKNEALLHNIDVSFEKSVTALPVVIADGEMLKQVFLNLSKNAIEAMKRGGKLSIRLATMAEKRQLQVEIIDSGPGIPEEVQEKIFEPFFTTKENGTGLGLPICRQILMELGGTIEPDSSEIGTTMRVYLPLA